ncbi:unnamed protein product [Durusdinium trenchii]|uniref:Uncharacterized protein n=1 Tax=Durusdinium trenchii TaxID=1381693 RepID=A0ABP0IVJ6_9DINO
MCSFRRSLGWDVVLLAEVSLCLDGLLLGTSAEPAVALSAFLALCRGCEVFTFAAEATEEETLELLSSAGAFDAGLQRHRVMFSSTLAGRGSMVRQLQPLLHLETSQEVVETLQGKVPEVRLVTPRELPSPEEVRALSKPKA